MQPLCHLSYHMRVKVESQKKSGTEVDCVSQSSRHKSWTNNIECSQWFLDLFGVKSNWFSHVIGSAGLIYLLRRPMVKLRSCMNITLTTRVWFTTRHNWSIVQVWMIVWLSMSCPLCFRSVVTRLPSHAPAHSHRTTITLSRLISVYTWGATLHKTKCRYNIWKSTRLIKLLKTLFLPLISSPKLVIIC